MRSWVQGRAAPLGLSGPRTGALVAYLQLGEFPLVLCHFCKDWELRRNKEVSVIILWLMSSFQMYTLRLPLSRPGHIVNANGKDGPLAWGDQSDRKVKASWNKTRKWDFDGNDKV